MHMSIKSFIRENIALCPFLVQATSVSPSFISSSWPGLRTLASLSPVWNSLRPVKASVNKHPTDQISEAVVGCIGRSGLRSWITDFPRVFLQSWISFSSNVSSSSSSIFNIFSELVAFSFFDLPFISIFELSLVISF